MTRTTDPPVVSVIIPAWNAAWCVGRAVESVLAQTFMNYELIVVDDGSTDATLEVLRSYGEAVRVISQANGGMSSARNAGIRQARGRYLAFLDADDRWRPEKLARQVELMEKEPLLAFCSASTLLEDEQGKAVGIWDCRRAGRRATLADIFDNHATVAGGASSVLARRDLVAELGGFDETLRGAEDTDLWIRLAACGSFACIADPLVVVMRRSGSVSGKRATMRDGAIAMTRKNRRLLPIELQGTFWRRIYAGVLCDYAKWAYREGHGWAALFDLLEALRFSPFGRGRMIAGLALAMLRKQPL